MAIRRAQASVLSGINSAANGWVDSSYNTVKARYIPEQFGAPQAYLSSTTWTRPLNVHFIDIALVGGGGSSSQTVIGASGTGGFTSRRGGGGGGSAVIQVNRFYVGDYDTWYIIIGGNSAVSGYGGNNCNGDSWGRSGNPTIFSPISSSYAITSLTGVDNSTLRRTLIAPGGGGGGHPCGSSGPISMVSSGGSGSNSQTETYRGIPNVGNSGKVPWQAYGGRGGQAPIPTSPGGGGGGSGATASSGTGGTGRTLISPFSGCYGGGGAGGGGTSGGCGGGTPGVQGTNGTGGGGGCGSAAKSNGFTGGTGRIEIRQWFSS
jgi:hypothetical protein